MEMPNLDELLHELTRAKNAPTLANFEDQMFLNRMLEAAGKNGAQGIIAVCQPDGNVKYMLINCDEIAGVEMTARVVQRLAQRARETQGG